MPIQYVGGQSLGRTHATGILDTAYSLTGGLASTPEVGDLVIYIANASNGVDYGWGASTFSSYQLTGVADLYSNDTNDTNMGVYYGILTSVPSVWPMPGTADSVSSTAVAIAVFRGVDPVNPFDVTSQSATGIDTGVPTSPSITPITTGSVAVFGVAATGASASPIPFTNSNLSGVASAAGNDTTDAYSAVGYKAWSGSGSISSGSWTDGPGSSVSNSWAAYTFALRPLQGSIKYWNGSSFSVKPVKYWNGTSWTRKPVKVWNGSAWVKTNY